MAGYLGELHNNLSTTSLPCSKAGKQDWTDLSGQD